MKLSNSTKMQRMLLVLGFGALLFAGAVEGKLAFAQNSSKENDAAADKKQSSAASNKNDAPVTDKSARDTSIDEYQRSAQLYYMHRMGTSGASRGEEIYYMDCWICHNDYTIKADPKAAPTLRNIYKRPKLMSGQAVSDETIANQIRDGSAHMPAFRATLNDKDMADLMSYLRDKCCWDEQNPPANPRYRY